MAPVQGRNVFIFPICPSRHLHRGLQANGDRQPTLYHRGPVVRRLAHLQARRLREQVHQDPRHRHTQDTQAQRRGDVRD